MNWVHCWSAEQYPKLSSNYRVTLNIWDHLYAPCKMSILCIVMSKAAAEFKLSVALTQLLCFYSSRGAAFPRVHSSTALCSVSLPPGHCISSVRYSPYRLTVIKFKNPESAFFLFFFAYKKSDKEIDCTKFNSWTARVKTSKIVMVSSWKVSACVSEILFFSSRSGVGEWQK